MIWVVLLLFFLFSFDKLVSFGDFCGVGSRVFLVIVVVLVVLAFLRFCLFILVHGRLPGSIVRPFKLIQSYKW